jgi:hypothetical protein
MMGKRVKMKINLKKHMVGLGKQKQYFIREIKASWLLVSIVCETEMKSSKIIIDD